MKILIFINYVPYLKSTTSEFRLFNIIRSLQKRCEVKVLVIKQDYVEEFKEKYNVDVEVIHGWEDKKQGTVNLFFGKKRLYKNTFFRINPKDFEEVFNRFKPNVILVNSLGFYRYVNNFNVPVIVNSNEVKYMEFTRESAKWPTFLRKLYVFHTRKIRRWERREFETSDMILFGSVKDMANVNSQMQLITQSRYLPVFAEKFEKKELKHNSSIALTLFDEEDKIKNMLKYINFYLPQTLKNYPDFHLYIITKAKLDLNIDCITVVPDLTEEILDKVRLYVLTNANRNNLSYYICKAAAFGVPIIGFEKSTDLFALRDKSKYMIISKGNKLNDLSRTIRSSFDNDDLLERVRNNAFEYVKERYNIQAFEKIMDDVYKKFNK